MSADLGKVVDKGKKGKDGSDSSDDDARPAAKAGAGSAAAKRATNSDSSDDDEAERAARKERMAQAREEAEKKKAALEAKREEKEKAALVDGAEIEAELRHDDVAAAQPAVADARHGLDDVVGIPARRRRRRRAPGDASPTEEARQVERGERDRGECAAPRELQRETLRGLARRSARECVSASWRRCAEGIRARQRRGEREHSKVHVHRALQREPYEFSSCRN